MAHHGLEQPKAICREGRWERGWSEMKKLREEGVERRGGRSWILLGWAVCLGLNAIWSLRRQKLIKRQDIFLPPFSIDYFPAATEITSHLKPFLCPSPDPTGHQMHKPQARTWLQRRTNEGKQSLASVAQQLWGCGTVYSSQDGLYQPSGKQGKCLGAETQMNERCCMLEN